MPQGQQTTPEIQWAIVRLSKFLDHERIAMCLDLSTRSIQRVLAHFQTYGTIPNPGEGTIEKMRVGRRQLRDVDVEVPCKIHSIYTWTNSSKCWKHLVVLMFHVPLYGERFPDLVLR